MRSVGWPSATVADERDGRGDERDGRGTERDGRGDERDGLGTERDGRRNERDGRGTERDGRGDEAERFYRRSLQLRPSWPLAVAALARRLALRSSRPALAEAERLVQATLASAPDHPLLLLVAGELALEREDGDAALAALTAAGAAGADATVVNLALARAHNLAAITLAAAYRDDEALFGFGRAAVLDPTFAPPHVNLGLLWQRLGKPQRALRHYRQAVALDARNGTAQLSLGLLLRDRGNRAGATQALTAAYASCHPPHPRARVDLAFTLSDRGQHVDAAALFAEEARVGDGDQATAWTNLGVAWLRADDLPRAQTALQTALAHDPGHVAALRNLAHVLARRGRLVDAAALVRRANPSSGAAAALARRANGSSDTAAALVRRANGSSGAAAALGRRANPSSVAAAALGRRANGSSVAAAALGRRGNGNSGAAAESK